MIDRKEIAVLTELRDTFAFYISEQDSSTPKHKWDNLYDELFGNFFDTKHFLNNDKPSIFIDLSYSYIQTIRHFDSYAMLAAMKVIRDAYSDLLDEYSKDK